MTECYNAYDDNKTTGDGRDGTRCSDDGRVLFMGRERRDANEKRVRLRDDDGHSGRVMRIFAWLTDNGGAEDTREEPHGRRQFTSARRCPTTATTTTAVSPRIVTANATRPPMLIRRNPKEVNAVSFNIRIEQHIVL